MDAEDAILCEWFGVKQLEFHTIEKSAMLKLGGEIIHQKTRLFFYNSALTFENDKLAKEPKLLSPLCTTP
jgi:hypothetical protein